MGFEFFTLLLIIAFLGVPGIMLSFALLRGVKLNFADKAILGIIIGNLLIPLMAVVEFVLFAIPFNSGLVLLNALSIFVLMLIMLFLQKQLRLNVSSAKKYFSGAYYRSLLEEKPVAIAVYAILIMLMLMGFYVRFATSWSTNFFEFDPYFYDKVTEFIVVDGQTPLKSDISYYPRFRSFRELPLMHYMTASWYSLYRDLTYQPYNQEQLILTIQFYPPLVATFLIFLAFIFIREESNKYIGLIAAALFAFTPQLVKKLGAGVSEQAPFGMFAAMFIFSLYALALNRKSYRLSILAGFALLIAILGSAHFIWPYAILTAFIVISSILEFLSGDFDIKTFKINIIIVLFAIAGDTIAKLYRNLPLFDSFYSITTFFLVIALAPSIIFYAYGKFNLNRHASRKALIGGLVGITVLALFLLPPSLSPIAYANSLLRTAKVDNPLNRTIQEENATNPGLFISSFGVLNPDQLLLASTILLVILAVFALRRKGWSFSLGYGALAMIFIIFNAQIDKLFAALSSFFEGFAPDIALLLKFFIDSDVFLYLIISLISISIYYYYEEKGSKMTLLFLLAFFPTAYVGLSKVKYLLHLAFALALALPFVLMTISELIERINAAFKLTANENAVKMGILVLVMLIGTVAAYKQYETTPQSMAELQYSRISSDWVDATSWMRDYLTEENRVISWWDYGHWTTFFGGAKTVLDPSNYYSDYDQLTARGFVHGNTSLLIDVMHYHKATHILVDSELVPKWGALVYLSGTFHGLVDDHKYDFLEQEIASTESPGSSDYEREHYFEYIYGVFTQQADGNFQPTQCPGVIPKQMFYSSFGAPYCVDAGGNWFFLNQQGEEVRISPPRLVKADDSQLAPAPLGNNLFYNQRYSFINLAPDLETLSDGRLKSDLEKAAFVNLFFLEELDGFKKVYTSPNAQVKIFELVK